MRRIIFLVLAVFVSLTLGVDGAGVQKYSATCTGDQNVPPTNSSATARVRFDAHSGNAGLYYEIYNHGLTNIVSAHIHIAPPGSEGPVAAILMGGIPAGSHKESGRIGVGIVFAADLVGPFDNATSLTSLLDAIKRGRAYVDFHTNDGAGGTNLGPGDFGDGEVRGQIR
jgi:hypothetical protein